jgi:hypothetical protein
MNSEITTPTRPSFGARLWHGLGSFLRFLLRLAFVVVVAIILGTGVYFGIANGVPALQRQYVQPVQDNSLRLDVLEARHDQYTQQIASRLDTLTSRLETLEAQGDINKEIFANQQAQLDMLADAQATQASVLDDLIPLQSAISDNRDTLDDLQSDMQVVQANNKALEQAVSDIQVLLSKHEALAQEVSENSQNIQVLSDENMEQGEQLVTLQRDLQLLWTLDLLTRSRLFMEQDNSGLARTSIQAAGDKLAALQDKDLLDQSELVEQIAAYLERVVVNLPDNPQSAQRALDNAWQLLVLSLMEGGIAGPSAEGTSDLEGETMQTPTPTPAPPG